MLNQSDPQKNNLNFISSITDKISWMIKLILALLFTSYTPNYAQEPQPDRVIVQSLRPGIKLDSLSAVYDKREKIPTTKAPRSTLPTPAYRDRMFTRIGIKDRVKPMDHLDRDLLFLKLKRYQVANLVKEYPWLKIAVINKFKKLVFI